MPPVHGDATEMLVMIYFRILKNSPRWVECFYLIGVQF